MMLIEKNRWWFVFSVTGGKIYIEKYGDTYMMWGYLYDVGLLI